MSAPLDYRDRIRQTHETLSRSYRRVADFILTYYYEVSFMTAAQLAYAVGVDTTTVVRFSQRLGYNGYPALLHEIRALVRAEIYGAYVPVSDGKGDGEAAGPFRARVQEDQHSLMRLLVHNPAEHTVRAEAMLGKAERVLLIGEGFGHALAEAAALHLRETGRDAWAVPAEPVRLAAWLAALPAQTLVIGVTTGAWGREVGRALDYARTRGLPTLGVVNTLSSPLNMVPDVLIYAPADAQGVLPGMVALASALGALVAGAPPLAGAAAAAQSAAEQVYEFLTQPDAIAPDENEP